MHILCTNDKLETKPNFVTLWENISRIFPGDFFNLSGKDSCPRALTSPNYQLHKLTGHCHLNQSGSHLAHASSHNFSAAVNLNK